MSKRLCACLLSLSLLLSLAACSRQETGEEVITRGRDFDTWWNSYGLPYTLTFGLHDQNSFDPETHLLRPDAHLEHNLYYLAYHTLLAEGVKLDGIHAERSNWENDPEEYLEYHIVPADLMADTLTRLLQLSDMQESELAGPDSPYDADIGGYVMVPPHGLDVEAGSLDYPGDIPLREVRIHRDADPVTATLLLREADPSQPKATVSCTVTYCRSGEDWQLVSASSSWDANDLVRVTGGHTLDTLSGLSASDCNTRFQYSHPTSTGILLLLNNNDISGYDLIHVDDTGKVLATGQLPDAHNDTGHVAINLYGDQLIISTGAIAFVGDLSLSRFLTYELTYWSWGGTPDSVVMLPDLTTWYYTGRDGIYQYNSETGEHVHFATHPVPIRDDDHGMSAQVYQSLSLAVDGTRLVSAVVGYEWISDIHVFDLTPGSVMTRRSLDRGWGYGGSGYAGNDYFIYHDASWYDENSQSYQGFTGGYYYLTATHFPLDEEAVQALGGSETGMVRGNLSGGRFAFLNMDNAENSASPTYIIHRAEMPGGKLETAATVMVAYPRLLGVFPNGSILACYDDYGHSGFIIA